MQAEHEAVKLRFRQHLRTDRAGRILCRKDTVGLRQTVGRAVYGDGSLLHELQKRGLCFRGCTVDLIGKQQIAECRALLEFHLAGILAVDREAGDIAGQNIRRELDAVIIEIKRSGKGKC